MHNHRGFLAHPEAIFFALGAAVLFGITFVLQHSAAATVEAKHSMRPRLLLELVRRPRWLLANVVDLAAFGLQFLALRKGSLLVTQLLLITGLLFALPLAAAVAHKRLTRTEWVSAFGLVLALSTFLALANPSRGRPTATGAGWGVVLASSGAVMAILILTAPSQPGRARARHLGASCGMLFAVTAALAKETGHIFSRGLYETVTSWEPYAWATIACFGFLVVQSALHAGPLDASLPLLVIADPLVAAFIGIVAFRERIDFRPAIAFVELVCIAIIILAVFTLSKSPLVSEAQHQ